MKGALPLVKIKERKMQNNTKKEIKLRANAKDFLYEISEKSKAKLVKQCELDDKRSKAYEIIFSKQDTITMAVLTSLLIKDKEFTKLGKSVKESLPIKPIKTTQTAERLKAEFKTANDRFDILLYENEKENKYSFSIFFYKGVNYYFAMRDFFCFSEDAALVKILQILSYSLNDDFSIRDESELRLIRKKLKKIENSFAKLEIKLAGLGGDKTKIKE